MLHQFTDTVFRRRVYFFLGSRQAFVKYLTETYGKKAAKDIFNDAVGQAFSVKAKSIDNPAVDSQVYFVWLTYFDGSPRCIATLAHECYHTAVAVFDTLGIMLDDEEAVAYYMDAMVEQFLTALKE